MNEKSSHDKRSNAPAPGPRGADADELSRAKERLVQWRAARLGVTPAEAKALLDAERRSWSAASRDGSEAWNARTPGMELKPLSEAPAPAATAAERLRQMRNAVRQFRAEATSREGERSQLRLLSSPLYRCEKTEGDLIDGALFAFVQATDPDVVLLIEARRGAAEWQYGLARLNSIALRAFFRDREVWSAPELPWRQVQDRSQPYFSRRFE